MFSIKFILLCLLFLICHSSLRTSKKYAQVWAFCTLLSVISTVFHLDYFPGALSLIFDMSFFYCVFSVANNDKVFREVLYKTDVYLSIIMAAGILVCFCCFQVIPDIFTTMDIEDYPVHYHRVLGTVSAWGGRVVGFFNEPSYTGFYLGVHFFLIIGCGFIKKIWKVIILLLIIADFFMVLSLGAFIYMIICLILLLLVEFIHINPRIIKLGLFFGLFFAIFVLPNFNAYNLDQDIVDVQMTSSDDRQYRMVLGDKVTKEMSPLDMLVGKGIDSVANQYKIGLSDVYRKLYVEYGLVFLLFFMWFLNKMLGKNVIGYSYVLLSGLSIIIVTTPIAFLAYLSYYTQNRIKSCHK